MQQERARFYRDVAMGLYLVHPEAADFTSSCKELLHSFQRKGPHEVLDFERISGCFGRLWYWNITRTKKPIILMPLASEARAIYQENKYSPTRSLGASSLTVESVLPRTGLIRAVSSTFSDKAILEFCGSAVLKISVLRLRCLFAGSLLPPPTTSANSPPTSQKSYETKLYYKKRVDHFG